MFSGSQLCVEAKKFKVSPLSNKTQIQKSSILQVRDSNGDDVRSRSRFYFIGTETKWTQCIARLQHLRWRHSQKHKSHNKRA